MAESEQHSGPCGKRLKMIILTESNKYFSSLPEDDYNSPNLKIYTELIHINNQITIIINPLKRSGSELQLD